MRVLLWLEPYPVGDHVDWLLEPARLACAALQSAVARGELEGRLFARDEIADALEAEFPEFATDSLRLLEGERVQLIDKVDGHWDAERVARWLEFAEGKGESALLHAEVLSRLYGEYEFELVLLVSESKAVEAAARKLGAGFAYLTPGPARVPFPTPVFLDGVSPSGRSAMSRIPTEVLAASTPLPAQTWLATSARNSGLERGVLEGGILWPQLIAHQIPTDAYAYLPLHLADQPEALRLGAEGAPEAFLARAIAHFRRQGLKVVVRGHSAAVLRPYNLAIQARALAAVQALGDVVVVPSQLPLQDTLALLAQAELTCTLDPSSAFESLLLGKPCCTLARLAFDVGGRLRGRGLSYTPNEKTARWDTQLLDVLMGHVLLPMEDVVRGIGVAAVLEAIVNEQRAGGEFGDAFWSQWLETRRPGREGLAHRDGRRPAGDDARRALADGSSLTHLSSGDYFISGDSILVDAVTRQGVESFSASRATGFFIGQIDSVDPVPGKPGLVRVRGWALEKESIVPPSLAIALGRSTLLSCVEVNDPRPDVARHYPMVGAACGFCVDMRAPHPGEERSLMLVTADNHAQVVPCKLGPFEHRPQGSARGSAA